MEYDAKAVAERIMDTLQKEHKELKSFNIMVLGKTGVGKSTLINKLFSEKIADTGYGRPVTHEIRQHKKDGFPLTIYDTPGLELGGENSADSLIEQVRSIIHKGVVSGDISNVIHCVLYCVSVPSNRFEDAEKRFLAHFLDAASEYNVPVIVVLTQAYAKKQTQEMKKQIEQENMKAVGVIPVLAEDYEFDEDQIVKAHGMEKLAALMDSVIPEAVQKTFVSIQSVNLDLKQKKARTVVTAAATAAAVTGATPIPFSDAALLIPEQITMLAGITTVFGLPMEKSTLTAIVSATIGTAGTTVLGKTIVSGLLKFIPGIGSVAGGAISAAAAAALTAALGEAYIALLTSICKGELLMSDISEEKGKQTMAELFQRQLKLKRNSKGEVIR